MKGSSSRLFQDRREAGELLARSLESYKDHPQAVVIALPRGGVIVGHEIAMRLHLPLDIVSPRKIGAPFNPEFAIGAVTETGETILSDESLLSLGISPQALQGIIEKEQKRAKARLQLYRGDRPPRALKEKIILLIDDGIATGSTLLAAIRTLKREEISEIIVAVPVAPKEALERLAQECSRLIVLSTPEPFFAVGEFYQRFDEVSDQEVIDLLKQR